MKGKYFLFAMVLLFLLIFFVLPPSIGRELKFIMVERIPLSVTQEGNGLGSQENVSSELMAFMVDQGSGFLSPRLDYLRWRNPSDDLKSLSAYGEAVVVEDAEDSRIEMRLPQGGLLFSVPRRDRVPLLREDRLFLADSAGLRLEEFSFSGKRLWGREFPTMITSLSAGSSLLVVGELSGQWNLLDSAGELLFKDSPGGSRLEIVYGAALSPDENRVAVVAGLDPQRTVLYEKTGETFRPVFHVNIGTDYRRPFLVGFSEDNRYLYWETEGGVSYFSLNDNPSPHFVPLPGILKGFTSLSEGRGIALFSETREGFFLTLINGRNEILLEKKFPGKAAQYQWFDDELFGVIGDYIYRWGWRLD